MDALHHSLAQANGWGSAGQYPADCAAKTPAARASSAASRRPSSGCNRADGDTFNDVTAQLAELRRVACAYYEHSDLTRLTREGAEAADRLAELLGYPEEMA